MPHPQPSNRFPGEWRQKDDYSYFLPGDLFRSRDLVFESMVLRQLEQATLKLGQFSSKIKGIPDTGHLIRAYTRKEATQSTRIEGTQADIEDAFQPDESEIAADRRDDWHELQQYMKAMDYAINRLRTVPLGVRLMKESHAILLSQARGEQHSPGAFRTTQNWIGGNRPSNAHFVPPSHEHVAESMSNLEKFIHDERQMPDLIKIALIHYQFETIHPFLDGNGRMGRMLIPLYLIARSIIEQPILYISDFFESHRNAYYDALNHGRQSEQGLVRWVSFFLDGVTVTATQGLEDTHAILDLQDKVRRKISQPGRRIKNAQALAEMIFKQPVVNAGTVRRQLEISPTATQQLLADFVHRGVLSEMTGRRRNRIYAFRDYLQIISKSQENDDGI